MALSIEADSSVQEIPDSTIIDNIENNLRCTLTISFTEGSALSTYFNIIKKYHVFSFSYDSDDTYPNIDFVSIDAFNLNSNFEYNQDALTSIDGNNNGIIDPNEWNNEENKGSVILSFKFSDL